MKVKIRPLEMNDAYTSVKWRNIPDLWTFTTFNATREITIGDELQWIERVINDPTSARFAILADDVHVGNIYLTDIKNQTAKYHIFIGDKDYWGKGIARQASVQIIDYGKSILKLQTIILGVNPENERAHHLYQTMGFIDMGTVDEDGLSFMKLDMRHWKGDPRGRDKIK